VELASASQLLVRGGSVVASSTVLGCHRLPALLRTWFKSSRVLSDVISKPMVINSVGYQ
jgi:hypothetical protein